jgi:hypothetical protein
MPESKKKGTMVNAQGEVVLDFSGVKPFEPLDPAKKYLCRVTKLERGSGPKGPKSSLQLTIEAPDESMVEEWIPDESAEGGMAKVGITDRTTKAKGRMLFREFSLVPQALPFLHEFIKAVTPDAKLDDKFRYLERNYGGLPVAVSITNEAFEEQIRARVKHFYPASSY